MNHLECFRRFFLSSILVFKLSVPVSAFIIPTVLLTLIPTLLATPLFAGDLQWAFERLKDTPESYEDMGSICEQVARLRLQDEYDSHQYRVETGLKYSSGMRLNLGELDVVVVREADNQAVLIGEVKCWRDLSGAAVKARKQKKRFTDLMDRRRPIKLHRLKHHSRWSDRIRFDLLPDFILISQDGGDSVGFDRTLGFSLEEMHSLRLMMLDCQNHGDCPSPTF